jgi:hypothetical protein
MRRNNNIYRIFVMGSLMMIATSILITINSGACAHWLATGAAIVALYHVVRGARR